jgi:hypothetical protein
MGNVGIAALAGLVVPFIVSYMKNTTWSAKVKQIVAVVISLVVALGITVIDNGVEIGEWKDLLVNLGVVFSVAQVFYQQYFGGTSVNAKLENIGVGAKNG